MSHPKRLFGMYMYMYMYRPTVCLLHVCISKPSLATAIISCINVTNGLVAKCHTMYVRGDVMIFVM